MEECDNSDKKQQPSVCQCLQVKLMANDLTAGTENEMFRNLTLTGSSTLYTPGSFNW